MKRKTRKEKLTDAFKAVNTWGSLREEVAPEDETRLMFKIAKESIRSLRWALVSIENNQIPWENEGPFRYDHDMIRDIMRIAEDAIGANEAISHPDTSYEGWRRELIQRLL